MFFSLPCWELIGPATAPVEQQWAFACAVVIAATVAMFACHLGPAAFARRFKAERSRFSWVAVVWIGSGYLAWIWWTAKTAVISLTPAGPSDTLPSSGFMWTQAAGAVGFLSIVAAAGFIRSWWKPLSFGGLVVAAALLAWMLAANWRGLQVENAYRPHYPSPSWNVEGLVLSAAPALVIGWQLGRIATTTRRVWLSGFLGLWLPLVASATAASLAARAGVNLFWKPSIMPGFEFALVGLPVLARRTAWTITVGTLLLPALVSAVSLKVLVPRPSRQIRSWLVPAGLGLLAVVGPSAAWRANQPYFTFAPYSHQFWAASLVILGAVAGLAPPFRRGPAAPPSQSVDPAGNVTPSFPHKP